MALGNRLVPRHPAYARYANKGALRLLVNKLFTLSRSQRPSMIRFS